MWKCRTQTLLWRISRLGSGNQHRSNGMHTGAMGLWWKDLGGLGEPRFAPKDVMLELNLARGAGLCQADTWKKRHTGRM